MTDLINFSISDTGVCRTALASPGLLIMMVPDISVRLYFILLEPFFMRGNGVCET